MGETCSGIDPEKQNSFKETALVYILLSSGQSAAVVLVLLSATIDTISINVLNIKTPFIQISERTTFASNRIVNLMFIYETLSSVNRHL